MQSSVDPLNPWSVAVGKEWSISFFWFRINQASITYLALVLTDLGDAGGIPYGPFFGWPFKGFSPKDVEMGVASVLLFFSKHQKMTVCIE